MGDAAATIGESIAVGVTAALGEAAIQGIAIGLGLQSRFSMAEAFETGVTASGGVPQATKLTDAAKVAKFALTVGTSAATTQLIEMSLGMRDKFDARLVAFQVSASIASSYLGLGNQKVTGKFASPFITSLAANTLSSVVNALIGSAVLHTPIEIQNIAANAIGSTIGYELGDRLKHAIPLPVSKSSVGSNQSRNSNSSHEHAIKEAKFQEALNFTLNDPVLNFDDASYQLSEMNRTRLERWNNSTSKTGAELIDGMNQSRFKKWNSQHRSWEDQRQFYSKLTASERLMNEANIAGEGSKYSHVTVHGRPARPPGNAHPPESRGQYFDR